MSFTLIVLLQEIISNGYCRLLRDIDFRRQAHRLMVVFFYHGWAMECNISHFTTKYNKLFSNNCFLLIDFSDE